MKKIIEKLKQLDKGTICRTILQFCAYANQIVAIIGASSFADAAWYQWTTFGITLLATGISYWYNNDWTNGAILVRDIFDMLKDGKIEEDELKNFIENHKKS